MHFGRFYPLERAVAGETWLMHPTVKAAGQWKSELNILVALLQMCANGSEEATDCSNSQCHGMNRAHLGK